MSPAVSSILPALEALLEHAGEHATCRQLWFLLRLAQAGRGGLSQREFSPAILAPSASRIAADLSRAGWIDSRRDPDDMRRRRLYLTAAGQRLFASVEEA